MCCVLLIATLRLWAMSPENMLCLCYPALRQPITLLADDIGVSMALTCLEMPLSAKSTNCFLLCKMRSHMPLHLLKVLRTLQ